MVTIGIVDDDNDKRGTLLKSLKKAVQDDSIEFIDIFPLASPDDYLAWISGNNINAIVMDWRLNEQSNGGNPVNYQGDALVKTIRAHLPYFPIFVLTAYAKDEDVDSHTADVELIEDRTEFGKDKGKLVKRLIRAASRFSKARERQLSRVSDLAKLCAIGKATAKDRAELRDLQNELNLAVLSESTLTQSSALEGAQALVDKSDKLIAKIEKTLEEKKK